jgi:serine/threonine protein kinase
MVPKSDLHLEDLHMPLNGRFQVIEILAAKLWTRTYRAQDLHRPSQPDCIITHLKAIPIVPNYRAAIRDLFGREVTVLEQVGSHAQIPSLLTWFEDEHGFYAVQEYVTGRSLSLDLLPQQPWTPAQVWQWLNSVLEPLAWVHQHGSIHGNLKPENLLRQENGQWLAIDFSSLGVLQQTLMAAHGLFVPPRAAAQQGYQPLEQLQGLACAASDVYALGMMAVQALTGVKPVDFQVDPDSIKILWQDHLPDTATPLQHQLIPILENMVQWDLPQRYGNAQEVLLALAAVSPVEVGEGVPAIAPMPTLAVVGADHPRRETAIAAESAISPPAAVAIATPASSAPNGTGANQPDLDPVPPVNPPESAPSPGLSLKSLLQSGWANPSVRLGMGGVAVATGAAAVGWGLLNSVDWSTQTGKIWQRIAAATSANGQSNSRSVKQLSEKWRQDWQRAAVTFQQVETAAQQGEWAKAKDLSATLPDIPYWRDRSVTLLKQGHLPATTPPVSSAPAPTATTPAELESAFTYARERKFTKALAELAKLPPGSEVDAIVKAKTQEYQEKQNVRAQFDLQRAFDRAIAKDFEQALAYLYQIPGGTDAYATAQTKIAEYKQKRQIQADVQRQTVSDRPTLPPPATLVSTTAIVPSPAVNSPIPISLDPATEQLNQQANQWLQQADQQINAGQIEAALATLGNVPLGTPAYAEARDRRLRLTAPLNSPPTPNPAMIQARQPISAQVAPERPSLIMGRADLQWVERTP